MMQTEQETVECNLCAKGYFAQTTLSLSHFLSPSLPLYPSISLSISFSFPISLNPLLSFTLSLSISLSYSLILLFFLSSICQSIPFSFSFFSPTLSIHPSISSLSSYFLPQSIRLSLALSLSPSSRQSSVTSPRCDNEAHLGWAALAPMFRGTSRAGSPKFLSDR